MVIKIKKGKIILEELTNKLNFSEFSINPGASILTNVGINISATITIILVISNKSSDKFPAKTFALLLVWTKNFEYTGINDELRAPSENILLNVFGNRNAT